MPRSGLGETAGQQATLAPQGVPVLEFLGTRMRAPAQVALANSFSTPGDAKTGLGLRHARTPARTPAL